MCNTVSIQEVYNARRAIQMTHTRASVMLHIKKLVIFASTTGASMEPHTAVETYLPVASFQDQYTNVNALRAI